MKVKIELESADWAMLIAAMTVGINKGIFTNHHRLLELVGIIREAIPHGRS